MACAPRDFTFIQVLPVQKGMGKGCDLTWNGHKTSSKSSKKNRVLFQNHHQSFAHTPALTNAFAMPLFTLCADVNIMTHTITHNTTL